MPTAINRLTSAIRVGFLVPTAAFGLSGVLFSPSQSDASSRKTCEFTEQTDAGATRRIAIPVIHFRELLTGKVALDQSGDGNTAYLNLDFRPAWVSESDPRRSNFIVKAANDGLFLDVWGLKPLSHSRPRWAQQTVGGPITRDVVVLEKSGSGSLSVAKYVVGCDDPQEVWRYGLSENSGKARILAKGSFGVFVADHHAAAFNLHFVQRPSRFSGKFAHSPTETARANIGYLCLRPICDCRNPDGVFGYDPQLLIPDDEKNVLVAYRVEGGKLISVETAFEPTPEGLEQARTCR